MGTFTVLILFFNLMVSNSAGSWCENRGYRKLPRDNKRATSQITSLSMRMCKIYTESVFERLDGIDGSSAIKDNCGLSRQKRIVGGQIVRPRTMPHMAQIGVGEWGNIRWICAATLISDKFLMTAALCADYIKFQWVRLGVIDANLTLDDARPEIKEVERTIVHPDFDRRFSYNDIALVKMKVSVQFNSHIRPICISSDQNLPQSATIAGWGATSEDELSRKKPGSVLKEATVELKPNGECNHIHIRILSSTLICALGTDGQDPCLFDNGGPLQVRLEEPYCMDKQIGIITVAGCNMLPSIYTRVAHFLPWIESIVWSGEDLFYFKAKVVTCTLST